MGPSGGIVFICFLSDHVNLERISHPSLVPSPIFNEVSVSDCKTEKKKHQRWYIKSIIKGIISN